MGSGIDICIIEPRNETRRDETIQWPRVVEFSPFAGNFRMIFPEYLLFGVCGEMEGGGLDRCFE